MSKLLIHGELSLPCEYPGGRGPSLLEAAKSADHTTPLAKPSVLPKGYDDDSEKNSDGNGSNASTPAPSPEIQRCRETGGANDSGVSPSSSRLRHDSDKDNDKKSELDGEYSDSAVEMLSDDDLLSLQQQPKLAVAHLVGAEHRERGSKEVRSSPDGSDGKDARRENAREDGARALVSVAASAESDSAVEREDSTSFSADDTGLVKVKQPALPGRTPGSPAFTADSTALPVERNDDDERGEKRGNDEGDSKNFDGGDVTDNRKEYAARTCDTLQVGGVIPRTLMKDSTTPNTSGAGSERNGEDGIKEEDIPNNVSETSEVVAMDRIQKDVDCERGEAKNAGLQGAFGPSAAADRGDSKEEMRDGLPVRGRQQENAESTCDGDRGEVQASDDSEVACVDTDVERRPSEAESVDCWDRSKDETPAQKMLSEILMAEEEKSGPSSDEDKMTTLSVGEGDESEEEQQESEAAALPISLAENADSAQGKDKRNLVPDDGDSLLPVPPPPLLPSEAAAAISSTALNAGDRNSGSPPSPSILASPRSLSPEARSPATGGTEISPVAGLMLPPMGGARQRFGLLGNLPPVGGRGLPSLALDKDVGNVGDNAKRGVSELGFSPRSPKHFGWSAERSPVLGSTRESGSRSASPGRNGRSGDADAVDEPPVLDKVVKDAEMSSRLALGDAGSAGDDNGNDTIGEGLRVDMARNEQHQIGDKAARQGTSDAQNDDKDDGAETKDIMPLSSPQQHQGREEEEAGLQTQKTILGTEKGVSGKNVRGDGGYFDDDASEVGEVSSVDEDISFEQDSSSGDGVGAGSDDDYFS